MLIGKMSSETYFLTSKMTALGHAQNSTPLEALRAIRGGRTALVGVQK